MSLQNSSTSGYAPGLTTLRPPRMCRYVGAGMHSFATREVLLFKKRKASTATGRVLVTFEFTTIIERVSDSAPPSPWNLRAYCPCVATMPSKPVRKSTCQKARLNSPSVTDCRPAACCIATALRMCLSSISRSRSAVIVPCLRFSRASFNSVGRSRLPTWSARKGGRVIGCSLQWEAPHGTPPLDLLTDESGKLPVARCTVVPQDEAPPIVQLHLEIAVLRVEPAVEDLENGEARFTQGERARLFLAAVAGVALDAYLQWVSIQRTIRGHSDSWARRLTSGPTCCSETPTSRS